MTASASASQARVSGALWRVLILLFASVCINYIDRGNLSVAAPLLKAEMGISASELGYLLSAFFWTYSAFQIVSGWLVDRFDVNYVLAGGFLLWSLATAATGFVQGVGLLFVARLVLGMGESVAYPCYSKILARSFAEHQRGLANALIDAGGKCGPALGTLAGGVLMARFGWRPVFIVIGLASMLWLPAWFRWMPREPDTAASRREATPSMWDILRKRQAWATFAGHFCGNYFFYFLLTWLPFYLVKERQFSMDRMAWMGSMAYLVTAAATTVAGWWSDRKIAAGATPTRVRKTCTSAGLAFASIVLGVTLVTDPILSMGFLMLACISYGVFASSHWAITQTIAGPLAAGKWTGLQNFLANLAGVTAPVVTGLAVEKTGSFVSAFGVAAAVVLVGAAVYLFGLGRVEAIDWQLTRPAGPVNDSSCRPVC